LAAFHKWQFFANSGKEQLFVKGSPWRTAALHECQQTAAVDEQQLFSTKKTGGLFCFVFWLIPIHPCRM